MSGQLKNRVSGSILPARFSRAGVLPFVFLIVILMLCGCKVNKQVENAERTPDTGLPVFTPEPLTSAGRRTPLTLTDRTFDAAGCSVRCPNVCEEGFELLNIAIRTAFVDFAVECSENAEGDRVDHRVAYNDCGLLSLILYSYRGSAGPLALGTASFDCDTGERVYLSDLMGSAEGSYRFAFADKVTEKLTADGYSIISYVPPVDDSRLCCFDTRGLVLIYRLYEICDADAGEPYVLLSFADIEDYLSPSALLRRLPCFDGRGSGV